jgi:hypothetical protein
MIYFYQNRRCGKVIIPNIVMRNLEMPLVGPGGCIQCQYRISKKALSWAVSTVKIVGGSSSRGKNNASFYID